jgi:hypothetical protein
LENAVLAIDGCINTLVMARIIIEERLEADAPEPVPGIMGQQPKPDCQHEGTRMSIPGSDVELCDDCGVTL